MSDLGIYFGPGVVDVSEAKGKKLASSIQIPFSEVGGSELDEKVPSEVKLAASFNDAFRRNKIEVKEAMLCLAGRDLIIRTFEIPILPREEIKGAINFEAKKYIPFKIEELVSDYQLELDKLSRTNIVLFMGMKKEVFDKYSSILSPLNIKVSSIEYSGFSLLRILKLLRIDDRGVTSILCFDSQGQDEINFIVMENGFPLFNRDIALSSAAAPAASDLDQVTEPAAPTFSMEKLKSEIRVSLDYYHRKFPSKPLKSVFVISNPEWHQETEAFLTELGLSSKFIDLAKAIGSPVNFSSSFAKSYSAAIAKRVGIRIKFNLIETKLKETKVGGARLKLELGYLFKQVKVDFRIVALAVVLCAAAFVYGSFQTSSLQKELNSSLNKWSTLTKLSSSTTYDTLRNTNTKNLKTLVNLDDLLRKQLYMTDVLDALPRAMPAGVWLNRITFNKKEEGRAEAVLEGMCYLGDGNEEFQAVNKFFTNLNTDPVFTKYFKDIKISVDHSMLLGKTVTTFMISCRTYKDKK